MHLLFVLFILKLINDTRYRVCLLLLLCSNHKKPSVKVYSVFSRDIDTYQVLHVIAQEYIHETNILAVSLFMQSSKKYLEPANVIDGTERQTDGLATCATKNDTH